MEKNLFVLIFAAILIAFGVSLITSLPVWLLWNWLMPTIFGITKLTFFQAWGLTFLCSLLFKSADISIK